MQHRPALSVLVAALATCAFGVLFFSAYWLFLLDDDQGRVRKMIRFTATALLCFVLGCATPHVTTTAARSLPEVLDNELAVYPPVMDMEPTPLHRAIFDMMRRCSGVSRPFEAITWKTASFITDARNRSRILGSWFRDGGNGGSLALLDRRLWNHPPTIAHEILHYLHDGIVPGDIMVGCIIKDAGVPN